MLNTKSSLWMALACFLLCPSALAEEPKNCAGDYEKSHILNAAQLIAAAKACISADTAHQAVAMLMFAQVRAAADAETYEPSTPEATETAADLYRELYFSLGGLGPKYLYRDNEQYALYLEGLKSWKPRAGSRYSPGWAFSRVSSVKDYEKNLLERHKYRISQVEQYRLQMNDTVYSELDDEFQAIRKRNPRGLIVGSADGNRVRELQALMRRRNSELPVDAPEKGAVHN